MKKGEVYIADYGMVRIVSTSKHGVLVTYLSGHLKGREGRIDKAVMRGKKRFIETKEKE
jgi:hypothetical protein